MIVKSIRNILLKVRLYHSKPDHCGIEASVIDTLKPINIRVKFRTIQSIVDDLYRVNHQVWTNLLLT